MLGWMKTSPELKAIRPELYERCRQYDFEGNLALVAMYICGISLCFSAYAIWH